MIRLDKITKVYGTKTAVEELSLEVRAGELFAFLGPNGAGKTTTIKMMCGLLFPTTGQVLIGGHDIQSDGDRARQLLSYVPDQPYLYEKLTGREFLQFIADMYGLPPEHARKRIADVINLFNLHGFVDDLTERYSHGMRQRTVFASALVHEPQVLVVDEPTVGLDPRSVRDLKDLLRRQADQGTTVFLSSHSLDVVEELADRIAIINQGRLIGCGTLEALRTQAAVDGSLEEVFLTLTMPDEEAGGPPGPGGPPMPLDASTAIRTPDSVVGIHPPERTLFPPPESPGAN
jgi:ABC-2 type transport system ATP-binding protein